MSLRALSLLIVPTLIWACSSASSPNAAPAAQDQPPREPEDGLVVQGPTSGQPPAAPSPPGNAGRPLTVCWVEGGHHAVPGGEATASGMLVRHPSGDLLVDAGDSTHYEQEIQPYTGVDRLFYETVPSLLKPTKPFSAVLQEMGVDPAKIKGFLPTHIHVDHVGGMMDMPDMPVYFASAEEEVLRQGLVETIFPVIPAHAKRLAPLATPLPLTGPTYEGYAASRDFFGDGSLVVVPMPGHTPGSVGVFVNFPDGTRLFHVGDAVSTLDQLAHDAPKSFPLSFTDADPGEALTEVHTLHALAAKRPNLPIIPAHDRAAWQAIFGQPGGCVTKTTGS